jgi:predicted nucleic acid-binding protein
VIVLGASAALSGLLNDGPARREMTLEQLHVPQLVDAEIASGLRGLVAGRKVEADKAWNALRTWRRVAATRHLVPPLFERIWQLRDNLSAYDATYVALAEQLDCRLLTADSRMSAAPRIGCPVTVVPR